MTFEDFVRHYDRGYEPGTQEYSRRERLFLKHAEAVERHNCGDSSSRSWKAGVNNLADWSEDEFDSILGPRSDEHSTLRPVNLIRDARRRGPPEIPSGLPSSLSWGNLTTINTSRHQGRCGSCWALAAITAMDAHAEIKGKKRGFSLAQIVACAPNPHKCGGTGGCHGATAELAFDYALRSGLVPDSKFEYPYSDVVSSSEVQLECPADMVLGTRGDKAEKSTEKGTLHTPVRPVEPRVRQMGLSGWTQLPQNKHEPLMRALVEHGPAKVSVATGHTWHIYSKGIMNADDCDPQRVLRHAVIMFGYGEDAGTSYWSLKNSWGPDWGEHGNMRLERTSDEDENCGWDDHPDKGSGCEGGPSRVWVCGTCGILYQASLPHFA